MIRFPDPPASPDPSRTTIAVGADLTDALELFGRQQDCIECSTATATLESTGSSTVSQVRRALAPLAIAGPTIQPVSGASVFLRRSGYWTEIDIDARAQRLHSVRMPSALVGAQRLLAINDLRGNTEKRPVIAIGIWALFAHPVMRLGARFGGTTDGLTAEIALAVKPDRYVLIQNKRELGVTIVLATPDIVTAELVSLAVRYVSAGVRGTGPWEDPLVQAATELNLGVRGAEEIDFDTLISPTISYRQRIATAEMLVRAAELIGVGKAP